MNLQTKWRTLWLAGLALFALAASAQAADTIKVGLSAPMTGPFAATGTYTAQGAKIGVDEVNRKGGVLGGKLELLIEDNKSNPKEAVVTAEKLIVRDEVPVLIGAGSSTATLSMMPRLMEYGVPMVVETSSSSKITVSGNPWVFRTAATSVMEAAAFARQVGALDIKKADFLVVNNDFGRGAAHDFAEALKARGVGIGTTETMDPAAPDLTAQLANLKSTDSDTVIVTATVEQLTLVLRQATALRLGKKIITTGGSQSPDQLIEQAGAAANGSYHILFFAPWFPDWAPHPGLARQFVEEWKKRGYNFAGLTQGFRGFDAVLAVAAAIDAAGEAEPKAIREALWEVKTKGVNGDVAFAPEGPKGQESGQNVPNIYVVQIRDGKVVRP